MKNPVLVMVVIALFCVQSLSAQSYWQDIQVIPQKSLNQERPIKPAKYRALQLDLPSFKNELSRTPSRGETGFENGSIIDVPSPDGRMLKFRIGEAPILTGRLQSEYAEIKTFTGIGVDNTENRIYLDHTSHGFHAMVFTVDGSFFVDPLYTEQTELYQSYYRKNLSPVADQLFTCGFVSNASEIKKPERTSKDREKKSLTPVIQRIYRIAIAATGEYTAFHGGTVQDGLAAIVTALNRVRGIYEEELAVSFTLVPDNDMIVYTDPVTDPYTNNNGFLMLSENQLNLDLVIGTDNYDVGHVFSTGGGGVAGLAVICDSFDKARGVTGLNMPINDPFYVDYVAHELGHQFGGNHTFNGDAGSCSGGNRNGSTAYEPGSGSTIQAYAGICGAQNIQQNSDPYFHLISLMEMSAHISDPSTGGSCPTEITSTNQPPVANGNEEGINGKSIPAGTPFELTGSATDPDGDPLVYNWEQWDLGPAGDIDPDATNGPLFRSFEPSPDATRVFPQMSDIAENTTTYGEALSNVDRTLNFQFIARDRKNGAGGYDYDLITLEVVDTGEPFMITSQNTPGDISGVIEVTWNVAMTTEEPISCSQVDI